MTEGRAGSGSRAQSEIVGVAVLVTVTVLSVGAITVAAGTFVEDGVAAADTQRVADGFDRIDDHGVSVTRVEFGRGTLRVEPRTVRLLRGTETVVAVEADALVYERRDRRVAYLGGASVAGREDHAHLRGSPPVVVTDGRLLVDVVALNASGTTAVGGSDTVAAVVRTQPTHRYRTLTEDSYSVAVETATPVAWERAFATVGLDTSRRDVDDDGVPSVVASIPEPVAVDLAVHDLRAVISRG